MPRLTDPFDLQAHRGGMGLWPQNTLEAFGNALALGVSTLELDVHLTADDDVVVHHDPVLADARTIRHLHRDDVPETMPLLRDVAALLRSRGADSVGVNLEIKYDALAASELTSRSVFVEVVAQAIEVDGLRGQTMVQCFDWGVLRRLGEALPGVARHALVAPKYLRPFAEGVPSKWFDGTEVEDDWLAAAAAQGFSGVQPVHGYPFRSGVDDPAYTPFTTPDLVDHAHAQGLRVIPYVVNDPATLGHLVDLGVDGLITDRPDVLRSVLGERGEALPRGFPDEVTTAQV